MKKVTVIEARVILDTISLQGIIDGVKDTPAWDKVFDTLPSTDWDEAIDLLKLPALLEAFAELGYNDLASIRDLLVQADPQWNDCGRKFQDILRFADEWVMIVAPRPDTSGPSKWDAFGGTTPPPTTSLRRV